MKKEYRIRKNQEFSQVIQTRNAVKTPLFVMYLQPRKQPRARFGISAGKKLGNAVVRNRTKRQLRALIGEVFDFTENYDAILIVRPPFLKKTAEERRKSLQEARRKAGQMMKQGETT
jgi:ribonuclease P protein component